MKKESNGGQGAKRERARTNLYLALDILPGASHNDILYAYNRAKMTYSAGSLASYTLLEDTATESIMDEIERAFATLGNPARRREYDLEMGFETWTEDSSREVRSQLIASITSRKDKEGNTGALPPARAASILEVVPDFQANPEFEDKIKNCNEVDGAFLRAVRIYRQMSPEQLASRCKLSASHVHSIEEEDSSKLHHPVYLRGHVSMMCRALGLPDCEGLGRKLVHRMQGEGKLSKSQF